MTAKRFVNDRFVCDLDVELDNGRSRVAGQVREITEAGFACTVADPIAAGTNVTAYLRLVLEWGASEPIAVFGQVMWLTPTEGQYQIGLAFAAPTPDVWQRLDVLMKVLFGQISLPNHAPG